MENVSKKVTIKIAQDFSKYPAGRFETDGPYSGENFRNNYLIPAINSLDKDSVLEVDLDGARGYGSSFLEEAFGGLFRTLTSFSFEKFEKKVHINSSDPSLVEEILEYASKANESNA